MSTDEKITNTPPDIDTASRVARLEERVTSLGRDIGVVRRILIGNGGEGIAQRLSSIEERMRNRDETVNALREEIRTMRTESRSALAAIEARIGKLSETVDKNADEIEGITEIGARISTLEWMLKIIISAVIGQAIAIVWSFLQ